MEAKKEKLNYLTQSVNSLKSAIFWLEKSNKQLEVAVLYEMISEISSEVSTLANEVKTEMFKH